MSLFLNQCFLAYAPGIYVAEVVMALTQNSSHSFYNTAQKLIYFVGGKGRLWIDEKTSYDIRAGQIMLINGPCHQRYETLCPHTPGRLQGFTVRFDRCHEAPFAEYLRRLPNGVLLGEGTLELWYHFVQLREDEERKRRIDWTRVKAFTLAAAEALKLQKRMPLPWHQMEPIACRWAAMPGVSPEIPEANPPFAVLFRKSFGENPRSFARRMFIERTKVEMAHSIKTLAQIAHAMGFSSPSVFTRAFSRSTGVSPSRFRKENLVGMNVPQKVLDLEKIRQELYRSWLSCRVVPPGDWKTNRSPLLLVVFQGILELELPEEARQSLTGGEVAFLPGERDWRPFTRHSGTEWAMVAITSLPRGMKLPRRFQKLKVGRSLEVDWLQACMNEEPSLHRDLRMAVAVESLLLENNEKRASESQEHAERHGIDAIEYAKEYLVNHFASPLTLEDVANDVGLSKEHLARAFKAATGKTVFDFLRDYRIEAGKRILLKNDYGIDRVATEAGFSSTAHFCRVFRKMVGMSPGAWRATQRKSNHLQRNINPRQ